MPPPMNHNAFDNINYHLQEAYLKQCQESMLQRADEIRHNEFGDNIDGKISSITISADGTWQKRGFQSLNGAVTIIATDSRKCVDYKVKSKSLQKCKYCEKSKHSNFEQYEYLMAQHDCQINHIGSSGKMESDAVVECFQESIHFNKLRYVVYIGDGDTKSHAEVRKSVPYPGLIVGKGECIGHVQKRVGSRLRKLKATHKYCVIKKTRW